MGLPGEGFWLEVWQCGRLFFFVLRAPQENKFHFVGFESQNGFVGSFMEDTLKNIYFGSCLSQTRLPSRPEWGVCYFFKSENVCAGVSRILYSGCSFGIFELSSLIFSLKMRGQFIWASCNKDGGSYSSLCFLVESCLPGVDLWLVGNVHWSPLLSTLIKVWLLLTG